MKAEARNHDESSYAQPQLVVIKDLALDLKLDFDTKQIGGTATYTLEWKDKAAKQLVLDTRELSIAQVQADDGKGGLTPLQFALAPVDKTFGSKLTIEAPNQPRKVVITYHTAADCLGPAVVGAVDDRRQATAFHVQPVAGDPRAQLGAVAGHPERALHL